MTSASLPIATAVMWIGCLAVGALGLRLRL